AMPVVAAGSNGSVHGSAPGAAVTRIVGVGENLEFLYGFNVGRDLPFASEADRRAVHEELIGSFLAAVNDVFTVGVPAPQARKTGGPQRFLGEQNAGCETHQRICLAADQRQFEQLDRIELLRARGGG